MDLKYEMKNFLSCACVFEPHEFQNLNTKKVWLLLAKGLAELCGTAILLSMGCMSLVTNSGDKTLDHLSVVITFSFAIATSIVIFGHISGSHINPALTIADVVRGEKSIFMFAYYTIMQCFGAFIGYSILRILVPNEMLGEKVDGFCCNAVDPRMTAAQAVGVEILITGILSLVFCAVQDTKNPDAGQAVAIKFGVVCVALLVPACHFIGSGMNPARSFGPALYSRNFKDHWVYWVGPMSGAVIGSYLYCQIFSRHHPSKSRSVSRQGSTRVSLRLKDAVNHSGDEV